MVTVFSHKVRACTEEGAEIWRTPVETGAWLTP